MIELSEIKVSPCETFHLKNNVPLYKSRFSHVLKFHYPGLAPVRTLKEAFHITTEGNPAYPYRFIETFGYYELLSAVHGSDGYFHIGVDGLAAYKNRYAWCGNFQEGLSTVKNFQNEYYHIDKYGARNYQENYPYVGDYKDGIAVVCNQLGLHTHIDYSGKKLHNRWFVDLDVYHKGFARAKTEHGWTHIDKSGKPSYSDYYASVEPFYNNVARVETKEGALLTINTQGEVLGKVRDSVVKPWQEVSSCLVGFWGTETLATAVRLDLFNTLPGSTQEIADRTGINSISLLRLLRALWELGIIRKHNETWITTAKSDLLISGNYLADASLMWSDVNSIHWKQLANRIQSNLNTPVESFKALGSEDQLKSYHSAIDGYTQEDLNSAIVSIEWEKHNKVISAGRTGKFWLEYLLKKYAHLDGMLYGESYVFKYADKPKIFGNRYNHLHHDLINMWPHKADAILLPKVLHYFNDSQVLQILKNVKKALLPNGKIYLIEMLLQDDKPQGGLLDLNMWAESGGQLRTMNQWSTLFQEAMLHCEYTQSILPWLDLVCIVPKEGSQ